MSFLDPLLSKLVSKKKSSVIGVDIGSSSLKVVQLRRDRGQAVLETYGELALGPYGGSEVGSATGLPAEQIADALKDLIREAKVTSTNCGVSIPFARSLLSFVKLPYRKDEAEQKTVIELEARKYIPVPISEVQLDWFIVPRDETKEEKEKKETVDVLIVAVHNDELSLLRDVITSVGLTATFYEIEIFSTIRAVVDEPVKPVMVLDVGAASTKMYIVERGIVALSHALSVGSQDITRAIAASQSVSLARAEALKKERGLGVGGDVGLETVFSRIFAEARRVMTQYEMLHRKSISAAVLTGGGGVTKELGAYAKRALSIDVRIADPFSKTAAPAFMRTVLEEIGPEFAVAVGIALRKLDEN